MEWIKPLLEWYKSAHRDLPWRRTRDPYAILVSEIMLQQTRVGAVIPYYARFLEAFPTVSDLADAPEERLLKLWEGLGYYSRARNLQKAAGVCREKYGGSLPRTEKELLGLPGVGPYTAAAVGSIAFSLPLPAVDGNVLRVMARLREDGRDVKDPDTAKALRKELLPFVPEDAPGLFNQAMMELGACVCTPKNPACGACPVRNHCRANGSGTAESYPVRSAPKERRVETKTVFALYVGGSPLICRRSGALLTGLWQLPEREGQLTPEEALTAVAGMGLTCPEGLACYERKHIFTHAEWRMRVYLARAEGEIPPGMKRMEPGDALPTAWRICLPEGERQTGEHSQFTIPQRSGI